MGESGIRSVKVLNPKDEISDLAEANEELQQYQENLEKLVAARTDELTRANAELSTARNEMALLLESTDAGIYGVNVEGCCTFVNKSACRMLGYQPRELLDTLIHDRIHHRRPGSVPCPADECRAYQAYITGQGCHVDDEVFWRKDGTAFPVEYSSFPIIDGGAVRGAVVTFTDITERRQLQIHARHLVKMEALAQILDGIAHEMRNPLFIVTGNLQLLREKLGSLAQDETLRSNLRQIEEAARRMNATVNKFMVLAKPEKAQVMPCSVQAALQKILNVLSNDLMTRRVTVVTRFAPALPDILSDPQRLRDAFMNLILNAAQTMESAHGRGTLTVSTGKGDGWIEVRIQDDGPGVPPEYQMKIFEPFFSTKPLHEGIGLGLWTARSIVMGLKGDIRCESEPGHGATFIVRLPVHSGTCPPAER